MRILVMEPGKPAETRDIPNTLEATQKIVDGFIEIVRCGDGIVCVVNEEGKLRDMEPNFRLGADVICGPAFFCGECLGEDGGEFCGLTDIQVERLKRWYRWASISGYARTDTAK